MGSTSTGDILCSPGRSDREYRQTESPFLMASFLRPSALKLRNFKGIAELDLTLDESLTLLAGVNGAGKTSVLQALLAAVTYMWHSINLRLPIVLVSRKCRTRRIGRNEIVLALEATRPVNSRCNNDGQRHPSAPRSRVDESRPRIEAISSSHFPWSCTTNRTVSHTLIRAGARSQFHRARTGRHRYIRLFLRRANSRLGSSRKKPTKAWKFGNAGI